MALFRRNKDVAPAMPPEVEDYYQAEKRDRSGMAWLLGLGTLLVTGLLVIGLFLGGRLVYRKLKRNDKPTPVAVQTSPSSQNSPESSSSAPSTQSGPAPNAQSPGSTSSNPSPTATSSTNSTATGATGTTPTTATSGTPVTGPKDNFAIFIAVTVLVYFAHRKFSTR